jgi:hypothetical protein
VCSTSRGDGWTISIAASSIAFATYIVYPVFAALLVSAASSVQIAAAGIRQGVAVDATSGSVLEVTDENPETDQD